MPVTPDLIALSAEQAQALSPQFDAKPGPSCCSAPPAAARPRSTCAACRPCWSATRTAQALVMVPEINLTPQLEARFASALRPLRRRRRGLAAQRHDEPAAPASWLAAHSGAARIVLGTRMAVFASHAAAAADRGRRRARPELQAAGRRALLGARPGRVPRPAAKAPRCCWARPRPRWRAGTSRPAAEGGRYLRLEMPTRIGAGALPRCGWWT